MRNLALLTLPFLLSACTASEPSPQRVKLDETLLHVSATGRAEAAPNEARFSAGVQSIGANAAEASRRNNETINKVLAALDGLGVKKEDVQTRQVSLQRITYGPNKGRFEASNMIEVRMRDVNKAGEAIAATTDAGANVLSGPNLTVGDPEAARNGAYASAFKAARSRADAYAGAAGLKVLRVLTIRDGGQSYHSGMAADATMAMEVAPPPVVRTSAPMIRPGMNSSEVAVQVDFALGPK
ncbi:MAG TPA: SIMPL domain-containing protein [Allosphingosinicella sp.]